MLVFFFFQAEDGIRDLVRSRGLGDVYKRQLLRMLHAAEQVDSGRILFLGREVGRLAGDSVPFLRRNIGVVFQDFKLVPNWTVLENVALPLEVLGVAPRIIRQRVGEALERVAVSYTHLRAHETVLDLVCRLLLEKKNERHITTQATTIATKITLLDRIHRRTVRW